jgi:hypothetical protein
MAPRQLVQETAMAHPVIYFFHHHAGEQAHTSLGCHSQVKHYGPLKMNHDPCPERVLHHLVADEVVHTLILSLLVPPGQLEHR